MPTKLFTVNGKSLKFYLVRIVRRNKLDRIIKSNGGQFCFQPEPDATILISKEKRAMIPLDNRRNHYDLQYIHDCIAQNKLLDLNAYKMKPPTPVKKRRVKVKYSSIEDGVILRFVRSSTEGSTGNRLFQKLEQANYLPGRSWQSLRTRYRDHLRELSPKEQEKLVQQLPKTQSAYSLNLSMVPSSAAASSSDKKDNNNNLASERGIKRMFDQIEAESEAMDRSAKDNKKKRKKYEASNTEAKQSMMDKAAMKQIEQMAKDAGVDVEVVFHALIKCDGVVEIAKEFLANPTEFCNQKNTTDQINNSRTQIPKTDQQSWHRSFDRDNTHNQEGGPKLFNWTASVDKELLALTGNHPGSSRKGRHFLRKYQISRDQAQRRKEFLIR